VAGGKSEGGEPRKIAAVNEGNAGAATENFKQVSEKPTKGGRGPPRPFRRRRERKRAWKTGLTAESSL